MHHLYANAAAMNGYASGEFPDGAVIVFDLKEARAADHAVTEGRARSSGDAQGRTQIREHRRLGFDGFAGGDPGKRVVGANAASACFACHQAQKAHDYVFSVARE